MDSRLIEKMRDQKDDLVQFLDSHGWGMFEAFMMRRKNYFLEKMLGAVRSKNWEDVMILNALMSETSAVLSAFKQEPQRLEGKIDESNRS